MRAYVEGPRGQKTVRLVVQKLSWRVPSARRGERLRLPPLVLLNPGYGALALSVRSYQAVGNAESGGRMGAGGGLHVVWWRA